MLAIKRTLTSDPSASFINPAQRGNNNGPRMISKIYSYDFAENDDYQKIMKYARQEELKVDHDARV